MHRVALSCFAFLAVTYQAAQAGGPITIRVEPCAQGDGRFGLRGAPTEWVARVNGYYYSMMEGFIASYPAKSESVAIAGARRLCPSCSDEVIAILARDMMKTDSCRAPEMILPGSKDELPLAADFRRRLCDIAAVARERLQGDLPKVGFALAPTFCFRAGTWTKCDGSEALIMLQFGLADFLVEASKVCIAPLGVDEDLLTADLEVSPSVVSQRLREHPAIANRFAGLASNYFSGIFEWSQWSSGGERDLVASELMEGMEVFVLAHEYAHVALRHEIRNIVAVPALPMPGKAETGSIDVPEPERAQELAADSLGLILTMEVLNRSSPRTGVAYAGPQVLCGLLAFLDKVDQEVLGRSVLSGATHPEPIQRRRFLDGVLEQNYPVVEDGNARLLAYMDRFLEGLWIYAGPTVVAAARQNKGVREHYDCRVRPR